MRRDLSLVISCSSLHLPLAAGRLGVRARELSSGWGINMARSECSATLADLEVARLAHHETTSIGRVERKCGAYPERRGSATCTLTTAFPVIVLRAILTAKQM